MALYQKEGTRLEGEGLKGNEGLLDEIKALGDKKDGKLHISMKDISELLDGKGYTTLIHETRESLL